MPLLQKVLQIAADKLPKVVGPTTHALIDYGLVGSCLLMGAMSWRHSKRIAIGSVICGGAVAVNSMLTDYPGGLCKIISYQTHGLIDAELARLASAVSRLMRLEDGPETMFFNILGLSETALLGMTDLGYYERRSEVKEK